MAHARPPLSARTTVLEPAQGVPQTPASRMAEEIAMLDCFSGGRIISGFVRGTAVESLHGGLDPSENFERFQEAHDLIIECWTTPGPFRYEGKYYHYRAVNPWVLPVQKPYPDIWFPGTGSPESVVWAAQHQHPYMNLGALVDVTEHLKGVYIDTAKQAGFTPRTRALRVAAADPGCRYRREGHRVGPPVYVDRGAPGAGAARAQ